MQKTTVTWNAGDPVTATHLNQVTTDLTTIFKELSNENLTFTYDGSGQCTQVVDVENSVTINIDWTDFNSGTSKLYIQKVGDPKKWTVTYDINGYIASIVYA